MKAEYKDYYVTEKVTLKIANYANNNNLAIRMICEDEEPFAMLTVNLGEKLPPNQAYVDTNNLRTAFDFIILYNLGKLIGFGQSGFCTYPLIEFDLDEVKKYAD